MRGRVFGRVGEGLGEGFRRKEVVVEKVWVARTVEGMKVYEMEERERVEELERKRGEVRRGIMREEVKRVERGERREEAGRRARRGSLLSDLDFHDAEMLCKSLSFENTTRDVGAAMATRGLKTMTYLRSRDVLFADMVAKQVHFGTREDAYFWLQSAGEAAVKKEFAQTEEWRLVEEAEREREVTKGVVEKEVERVAGGMEEEGKRIGSEYRLQDSQLQTLSAVNFALSKGSSETIARNLRSFLSSNDSSSDR